LQDILKAHSSCKLLQGLILQRAVLFNPHVFPLLATSSIPQLFPLYVLKPSWTSWSLP
jgi:hypothetical protein